MKLKLALEEKLYDLRLRDKLLSENKISKSQMEKYLKNLEDNAGKAIAMTETEDTLPIGGTNVQ
jgi:hypothetical protein